MLRKTSIYLLAVTLTACGGKNPKNAGTPPPDGPVKVPVTPQADAKEGLDMRLSEGSLRPKGAAARNAVAATPLSKGATDALLKRLPPMAQRAAQVVSFAFRGRSQPPPRTGNDIKTLFAGEKRGAAPAANNEPLTVLRHAPDGDVPIAPHVSVTFSHPMVAITSHADTVAGGVPVTLTPQPAGAFRWLGTKTLLFDPEVRMPMATKYTVEIAKGTKSDNGKSVLAAKESFTFSTPAPTLISQYPVHGPHKRTPVMFVEFDQRVPADQMLKHITVTAGSESFAVRAATEKEIKADEGADRMVTASNKKEHEGRFLAFVADSPLPAGSSIKVTVKKGAPSAEGPLTTQADQSFTFQTYHPLSWVEARCGWRSQCPPGAQWYLRFNNPLDDSFDPALVNIEPKLAHSNIRQSHDSIYIRGESQGRTTYRITIPASLKDQFGQTLGSEQQRSITVGDADPALFGTSPLTILDPVAKKQTLTINSINIDALNVQMYKVTPADWADYLANHERNPRKGFSFPGKKIFDQRVKLDGDRDRVTETQLDLSKALDDGLGHVIVFAEPTSWRNRWRPRVITWVQSTRIGLDAFVDSSDLVGWATNLTDGRALMGATMTLLPSGKKATTDAGGTVTLAKSKRGEFKGKAHMLVAEHGKDSAFLPHGTYWYSVRNGGWFYQNRPERLSWFVFADRGMYKPGEKVQFKGWVRRVTAGTSGDVAELGGAARSVAFRVIGSRGNELAKGTATVNAFGGFHGGFELPKTPNLGQARIEIDAQEGSLTGTTYHHFQIQEFRRPEFEVTTKKSAGPHMIGTAVDVAVSAKYYAGGALPDAPARWSVTATNGSYSPPNRQKYTFGTWTPWWRSQGAQTSQTKSLEGKTGPAGEHVLHLDFLSAKPPRPMNVAASAFVTDVNRQTWSATENILVHPSQFYVGLKRDKYFVDKGTPIEIDALVVDHDGKAVAGRKATVTATRVTMFWKRGKYEEKEHEVQTCEFESSDKDHRCEFATPAGGRYHVRATIIDDEGRPSETQLTMWVTGGDLPAKRNVEQEEVTLIPDKKEYAPGETAKVLVQSPFFPADGILSLRRDGILEKRAFRMENGSTTLEIPIVDSHTPNLWMHVDLSGSAPRTDDNGKPQPALPRRPAFAAGNINLAVPPKMRTFDVSVEPSPKKVGPGESTKISVSVKDANGVGVANTDVVIFVVDEAVLALSSYKTPNPLGAFYTQRGSGTSNHRARQWLKLARPDMSELASGIQEEKSEGFGGAGRGAVRMMEAPMDAAEADAAAPPASAPAPARAKRKRSSARSNKNPGQPQSQVIAVRKNFSAIAAFSPEGRTDAKGRVTLPVTLPDNLTRYRVMAVVADKARSFGSGEANLTARKPLMIRPSPPRFLNFGDKFELPVVVQNQTDKAMTVEIAVRTDNATMLEGAGRTLSVPANDRAEVRFPAAADMPGTAFFQIVARSGKATDASQFSLPVWTPATTEAFATYGQIDKGAIHHRVAVPKDVVPQFGGVELTTSSTQLAALTDAFLYLVQYPYECAEQTSSRMLAVAALRDVLTEFKAKGLPAPEEIEASFQRDMKRLKSLQNHDGGFAFWVRGHRSWPYVSIHAAHAMIRAKKKGYTVPQGMLDKSRHYLERIESHIPHWYHESVKRTLIAYSLWVRRLMGDIDVAKAKGLLARAGGAKGLSMEAVGWVLGALAGQSSAKSDVATLLRYIGNKTVETAGAANWTTNYADGAHLILHSSRRTDAVLLESLMLARPKDDLIPKVVRGLLAHQKRGRWGNTQENAFVLLAMDDYFRRYEKVTPNFVAKAWLGNQVAAEDKFRGRETKRHTTNIPMPSVGKPGTSRVLALAKKGKGRLYYRIGMNYAPADLTLPPADHGFAVERVYEPVENDDDVKRAADGTWRVKAGALVRVRVTMAAENRRYHVALVDPMPAGLEALNPELAVTGPVPEDPKADNTGGRFWWWSRPWYEHQNMRDERVEAFASLLWAGVHEYSYVARATTPGTFVAPPPKAEEMYSPETFGRGRGDIVIVE